MTKDEKEKMVNLVVELVDIFFLDGTDDHRKGIACLMRELADALDPPLDVDRTVQTRHIGVTEMPSWDNFPE